MECFRLLLEHLAWIEHQFLSSIRDSKEGRESVRDDERCGRNKEVRTSKLIGQIKNFMDKDRRVSIETISAQFDVSVGTVHTIIREEQKMRKICVKFVARVLRKDQKERYFSLQQEDGRAEQGRSRNSCCSGDLRWKLDILLWPRDQETEFPIEACWLSQTQKGKTEQIHPQTFDDPFFLTALAWSRCTGFPLDRQSTRKTMWWF